MMPDPTPAATAMFDQISAAADATLDSEVAWMREAIAESGPVQGAATVVEHLLCHGSVPSLAMAYAWALRRLANLPGGVR